MFTKLIWELKQLRKIFAFPEKDSWAYRFHMWVYDLKVGPPVEEEKPKDWQKIKIGIRFPGDFNQIIFQEYFDRTMESINSLTNSMRAVGVHVKEVTIQMEEYSDADNHEQTVDQDANGSDVFFDPIELCNYPVERNQFDPTDDTT